MVAPPRGDAAGAAVRLDTYQITNSSTNSEPRASAGETLAAISVLYLAVFMLVFPEIARKTGTAFWLAIPAGWQKGVEAEASVQPPKIEDKQEELMFLHNLKFLGVLLVVISRVSSLSLQYLADPDTPGRVGWLPGTTLLWGMYGTTPLQPPFWVSILLSLAREDMIAVLVFASGAVAKADLAPKHWEGMLLLMLVRTLYGGLFLAIDIGGQPPSFYGGASSQLCSLTLQPQGVRTCALHVDYMSPRARVLRPPLVLVRPDRLAADDPDPQAPPPALHASCCHRHLCEHALHILRPLNRHHHSRRRPLGDQAVPQLPLGVYAPHAHANTRRVHACACMCMCMCWYQC